MPCNNPIQSDQLVVGTKYEVYPEIGEANPNQPILTGWFVKSDVFPVWNAERREHYGAEQGTFRMDGPERPGDDPNREYKRIWFYHNYRPTTYRYCQVQNPNEDIVPDEEMNGGRSKTRASRRTSLARLRSRRKRSQRSRVKSRRQQRK